MNYFRLQCGQTNGPSELAMFNSVSTFQSSVFDTSSTENYRKKKKIKK